MNKEFYRGLSLSPEQANMCKRRLIEGVRKYGCCWIWTKSTSHGYGNIGVLSGVYRAHRISFAAFNGPIPPGNVVMHSCDNRKCVNPDHLQLGTQAENLADCRRKGRTWHQKNPELASKVGRLHALRGHGKSTRT